MICMECDKSIEIYRCNPLKLKCAITGKVNYCGCECDVEETTDEVNNG